MNTHDSHSAPEPSIWPAALALGLTLFGFGLLTSGAFSLVGALLAAFAVAGWIQELRRA
jgi:hypothetical protein